MNLNAVRIISYCALIVIATSSVHAADHTERVFETPNGQVKVILTAQDWHHIVVGTEKDQTFSGGHDFGVYKKNHLMHDPNASVFFDIDMSAYIVSSKKGDALAEIIDNLQAGSVAKYHSFFPPNFITREFVISAFEKAFLEQGINANTGAFFTTYNNYAVAGYFDVKPDGYHIKTIFPDLSWHYRRDFQHNKARPFPISRFLEWDGNQKHWLQQGLSLADTLDDNPFLPAPIIHLTTKKNKSGCEMVAEDFALISSIRTKVAREFSGKSISLSDLFFDDPKAPTVEEFDLFLAILRDFIPRFAYKLPPKEAKAPISRKLILVKMELKKQIANDFPLIALLRNDGEGFFISEAPLGQGSIVKGLHFAEELLFQLLLNLGTSEPIIATQLLSDKSYQLRKQASGIVAANLARKLLGNHPELLARMQSQDIIFHMRLASGKYYALEVLSRNSNKKAHEDDIEQMGIFFVVGEFERPFEVTFQPYSIKKLRK